MNLYRDYQFSEKTKNFIELNGFETPTKIQKAVIPMATKGKDIIAVSDTGTGKTHAFLIPILEAVNSDKPTVQAVITAPTRELAQQIFNRAKLMMKVDPELRIKLVTGGSDRKHMADSMSIQPHIVIGTPGRIKDLFLTDGVLRIDTTKILVVDEADMTLEFGFLEDIDAMATRMSKSLQMMAFSATIPQALKPFLKKYMTNPQLVEIKDDEAMAPQIEHILIPCKHRSYIETCIDILPGFIPYVCLIFANTRTDAADCATQLRKNGYDVVELHGGLEARQRRQAMKQLSNLKQSFVVASDIAARGIDIEGITHVISLGFPSEPDFYIHRSGRTGRAGREGVCFAIYKESDMKSVNYFKERGIVFTHKTFKNGVWSEMKDLGQKYIQKNDLSEKQLSHKLTRKKEKVKPGYKKKKAEEVKRIKQKEKRDLIRKNIKEVRKERYKTEQRAKTEALNK